MYWLLINYLTVASSNNKETAVSATDADVAQSVERRLGKAEVTGSIPVISFTRKVRNTAESKGSVVFLRLEWYTRNDNRKTV